MTRRAYDMVRAKSDALKEALAQGFHAAGYEVHKGEPREVRPGDCLAIWNRRAHEEQVADRFEKAGGVVLVAENAYLPGLGYAVARHRHNGGGHPLVQDPARAAGLLARLEPWRQDGEDVLVLPNRWIGPRDALMPTTWAGEVSAALKRHAAPGRQIRMKPHPGHWKRLPPGQVERELDAALVGVRVAVIWWSSAGLRALLRGIPVISCAPYWIGAKAAGRDLASIEAPVLGDREAALVDVANSCMTLEEIASGTYFRELA